MKKKLCPNCGAELNGSCCEFCGYIQSQSIEKFNKVDITPFKLAKPELFTQEFDKLKGETRSTFLLKWPIDESLCLELTHVQKEENNHIEYSKIHYYKCAADRPFSQSRSCVETWESGYIIGDKSYKGLPKNLAEISFFIDSSVNFVRIVFDYGKIGEYSEKQVYGLQTFYKAFQKAIFGGEEYAKELEEANRNFDKFKIELTQRFEEKEKAYKQEKINEIWKFIGLLLLAIAIGIGIPILIHAA